jgi:hypothetical protein
LDFFITLLGGYWLGARQQQSSPTGFLTKPKLSSFPSATPVAQLSSVPTADPILEWNTYIDRSYWYEFKYPRKWVANRCGSTVFFLDYESSCATEPLGYVTIGVRPATQLSPQFIDYEQVSWEVRELQEITVGKVKGAKALLQKKEAAPGPERFLVVRLIHNRNEFIITLFDFQEIQTFDHILSTFHFLK